MSVALQGRRLRRPIAPGIGSVKRKWVARSARGLGLGHRLLEALEHHARRLGFSVLRLETNRVTLGDQG